MVNWESNVFPAILGRTCDRPCEPACRRGRVEKEPVAICRLKRVAADFKDDIRGRLPKAGGAEERQAHRAGGRRPGLAHGGARSRPARLPLRRCSTRIRKAGGMMRTQIPQFRLPETVHRRGVRLHPRSRRNVQRRQAHRQPQGAARGGLRRDLRRLRRAARPRPRHSRPQGSGANIHIGIDWLSSVSFGHINKIGKRVIVLGGGNTAMDCCRSSRRLGGEDVKVVVRSGFEEMKASPWEKEDAMHEDIPIFNFLVPKEFTHENGKLTGVVFEKVKAEHDAKGRRNLVPTGEPDQHFPCDDVLVAVGQENAFPWIERDIGIEFDKWDMPKVDAKTMASTNPKVFFGGDAAFGPKNIIWAVAHGHEAAISIDQFCRGEDINERPAPDDGHLSARRWASTSGATTTTSRSTSATGCRCATKVVALRDIKAEVELGFDRRSSRSRKPQRCLNCDVQTVFTRPALHRMRRLRRHLPDGLHHLHRERRGSRPAHAAEGAGDELSPRTSMSADSLKTGRVMVKDEDVCLHCGLCAERCPTGAWDMKKYLIDYDSRGDHAMPTPERKRLRRPVRQRQRLGLGQRQRAVRALGPAHGRSVRAAQHLSVQHPGPADLVRGAHLGSRPSRRPRRHRSDGGDESADLGQGRRRDRARRLSVLRFHQADAAVEIPRRHHRHRRAADRDLQPRIYRPAPAPAVQEHHLCRRALGAARHGRRRESRS